MPALVLFALVTAGFGAAAAGVLPIPEEAPLSPREAWTPLFYSGAAIFALATVALAVAAWRRAVALGAGVALAATIAFLPAIGGNGMTQFARSRSAGPLAPALLQRLRPGDLVVHEGAIATSASMLLVVGQPVRVVNGLYANLALGAALPEARDTFWDSPRLEKAWSAPGRHFLISAVDPARSVVRALPPPAVHLIAQAGGRRLYSSLVDQGSPGR